jgi:hypothetical protein
MAARLAIGRYKQLSYRCAQIAVASSATSVAEAPDGCIRLFEGVIGLLRLQLSNAQHAAAEALMTK